MKKTLLLAAASALLFMGCDQNQGGSDADQTSPGYGADQGAYGTDPGTMQQDTNMTGGSSTTTNLNDPGMTDPSAAGGTGATDQGTGTGAGAGGTGSTGQMQQPDTNSPGSGTQSQDQTAPPQQ